MSKNKYVANFLKTRTGGKPPAPTSETQPPSPEEVARQIIDPTSKPKVQSPKSPPAPKAQQPKGS